MTSESEAIGSAYLQMQGNVSVPRWALNDFLTNQPGWPDTARRYLNAPALAATPQGEAAAWRIVEGIPAINDLTAQFQQDIHAAILAALTANPAGGEG